MAEIFKPLRIWTNEDIVKVIQRVKQHHFKNLSILQYAIIHGHLEWNGTNSPYYGVF